MEIEYRETAKDLDEDGTSHTIDYSGVTIKEISFAETLNQDGEIEVSVWIDVDKSHDADELFLNCHYISGRDIIESMYGNISGDAIPRYIAKAGGKIPLHRSYVSGRDGTDIILKKPWNNEEVRYPDADPDEYAKANFSFTRPE